MPQDVVCLLLRTLCASSLHHLQHRPYQLMSAPYVLFQWWQKRRNSQIAKQEGTHLQWNEDMLHCSTMTGSNRMWTMLFGVLLRQMTWCPIYRLRWGMLFGCQLDRKHRMKLLSQVPIVWSSRCHLHSTWEACLIHRLWWCAHRLMRSQCMTHQCCAHPVNYVPVPWLMSSWGRHHCWNLERLGAHHRVTMLCLSERHSLWIEVLTIPWCSNWTIELYHLRFQTLIRRLRAFHHCLKIPMFRQVGPHRWYESGFHFPATWL